MKLAIGNTSQAEIETEEDKLHKVDLYRFSRQPIKALFDGHGQPVQVVDGGPVFYAIPVGLYDAIMEQIKNNNEEGGVQEEDILRIKDIKNYIP